MGPSVAAMSDELRASLQALDEVLYQYDLEIDKMKKKSATPGEELTQQQQQQLLIQQQQQHLIQQQQMHLMQQQQQAQHMANKGKKLPYTRLFYNFISADDSARVFIVIL